MLTTIIFFFALILSIIAIISIVLCFLTILESDVSKEDTLFIAIITITIIANTLACSSWTWLFYLLH